ncbi:hypothetical protein [Chondrinema litorale]|uniref:hypothetical protein n=1 Tax=Chondrinema litorale TaxID=2994555 RepID=UPI0025431AB8|nr:hypothetical protein [Chondrinema litorale]UZR99737.1 hypothetical protein OQ292_38245 [Chondrinema litorale]
MNRLNVITILILLLSACDNSPKFEYQSPTPKQASENLGAYLRQAPFENEWNQQGEDENTVVFTNAEQVFPFMVKFKNEDDDLKSQKYGEVKDFYAQQTVIYKDVFWGELFVYGGLLFNQEPLFLNRFFSEMGNPLFIGLTHLS